VVGLIVTVLPLIVIWALAIGIVVIVVLSELFLIRTFPVPALTDSLKFKTIFEDTATPVALSAGVLDERVGGVVSAAVVKFKVVGLVIPVKALSERSRTTPLAIST
jgi:hypothetical protein